MSNNFHRYLLMMVSTILLVGCSKDLYDDPEENKTIFNSEKIRLDQLLLEVNSPPIIDIARKNYKSTDSLQSFKRGTSYEAMEFEKTTKLNEYTTYSLSLNTYSEENPYFLNFIIQKSANVEKVGYEKYIPNSAITDLDIRTFSGTLQLMDINKKVKSETQFINGNILPSNDVQTLSLSCSDHITVIVHTCSHGGNHAPGTSCNPGQVNDGYYEIIVDQVCYDDNVGPPAPNVIVHLGGSSGGGGQMSNLPCAELTKMTQNTAVRAALLNLQTKTALFSEVGFSISKKNNVYQAPITITPNPLFPDSLPVNAYIGGINIGIFHTHPHYSGGIYPMFSPEDIYTLLLLAKKGNVTAANYADFVVTMTVPQGTFAIKIKDPLKFLASMNTYSNLGGIKQMIEDRYDQRVPNGNIEDLAKDLLDCIAKSDMGIGLYKSNANITSWSELIQATNPSNPTINQILYIPCN